MYFTDDSLLPENQAPLMITAAPYGPMWMPDDFPGQVPTTWEEQTQIAVDCYNAGATILHIHVRDPKTGHISKNLREYGEQVARLRKAVPKMILQVGGSISFAPEPGEEAKFQSYDSRHKLAEIDPKPDQVRILCGTGLYDLTALHPVDDSFQGTGFENPAMLHPWPTWSPTPHRISIWRTSSRWSSTGSSLTSRSVTFTALRSSSGSSARVITWDR